MTCQFYVLYSFINNTHSNLSDNSIRYRPIQKSRFKIQMIRLRTGHHYIALHTHNHQCLNNHDETTMTIRVKSKTFILNNSQNQSNLRPTRNPKWPTYSLQKDYFLNPMCWTDFSKSNTRHLIPDITCHACLSSKQRKKWSIFCWFSSLILIRFESCSPSVRTAASAQ